MRLHKTKRYKTRDGFALVVVLDKKPTTSALQQTEKVTILARRDMVRLQKLLRGSRHPFAKKVREILDNYQHYG